MSVLNKIDWDNIDVIYWGTEASSEEVQGELLRLTRIGLEAERLSKECIPLTNRDAECNGGRCFFNPVCKMVREGTEQEVVISKMENTTCDKCTKQSNQFFDKCEHCKSIEGGDQNR